MIDTTKLTDLSLYFIRFKFPDEWTGKTHKDTARFSNAAKPVFVTKYYEIPLEAVIEVRGPIDFDQLPLVTTTNERSAGK